MLDPPWTTKPPLGTRINWGHPLANGLVFLGLFNEHGGQPVDLVSGHQAAKTPPLWFPNGVQITSTATFQGWSRYPRWEPTSAVTLLHGINPFAFQGNQFASPICKTFNNNGSPSFGSWSLQYNPAAAGNVRGTLGTSGTQRVTSNVSYTAGPQISGLRYAQATGNLDVVVNGTLATTLSTSGAIAYDTTSTGDLYIGSAGSANTMFGGTIYWAAIWSRALTQGELRSVTKNPYQHLIPPSPTQRYWMQPPAAAIAAPVVPQRAPLGV